MQIFIAFDKCNTDNVDYSHLFMFYCAGLALRLFSARATSGVTEDFRWFDVWNEEINYKRTVVHISFCAICLLDSSYPFYLSTIVGVMSLF